MAPNTLRDLRTIIAKRLNFNVSVPDQDFQGTATDTWKWLDDAINEAYLDEINTAVLQCSARPFTGWQTFVWSSGQLTYQLPVGMDRTDILSIFNTTSSTRGSPLVVGDRLSAQALVWRDRRTMEWGSSGPGADTTLAFQYIMSPEELTQQDDEPQLIPPRFRYLLVWGALLILRDYGDENAPRSWVRKREDMRAKFQKFMSATSPRRTGLNGPHDMASVGLDYPSYP